MELTQWELLAYTTGFFIAVVLTLNAYLKKLLLRHAHEFSPADFRQHRHDGMLRLGDTPTAVVTGGNGGVGLSIVEQLISNNVRTFILCRNIPKCDAAMQKICKGDYGIETNELSPEKIPALSEKNPRTRCGLRGMLYVVQCDIANLDVIREAVTFISQKVTSVDYLFLNAHPPEDVTCRWSILLDFSKFRPESFTDRLASMFETSRLTAAGESFLIQSGHSCPVHPLIVCSDIPECLTKNNPVDEICEKATHLQVSFAFQASIIGHYTLIRSLQTLLLNSKLPYGASVVWTSSRSSSSSALKWESRAVEIRDSASGAEIRETVSVPISGEDDYGVTKYLMDCLSHHLNEQWLKSKIRLRSYVCCPGLVNTGLPPWPLKLFRPCFWIVASFFGPWRIDPKLGAEVLLKVAALRPDIGDIFEKRPMKFVCTHGNLRLAKRGVQNVERKDQVRLQTLLDLVDRVVVRD